MKKVRGGPETRTSCYRMFASVIRSLNRPAVPQAFASGSVI